MKITALFLLCGLLYQSASAALEREPQNTHQKQQEIKKLKDDLYTLEGAIFYKKHLSPVNTLREKTAFIIAIAGICASCVTPFKFVKTNPKHRIQSYAKRLGIMAITMGSCALSAGAVSFFRPTLWYQEYKRDCIKKKIFELQSSN